MSVNESVSEFVFEFVFGGGQRVRGGVFVELFQPGTALGFGTAMGKADRGVQKVAKAGSLAKKELDDLVSYLIRTAQATKLTQARGKNSKPEEEDD